MSYTAKSNKSHAFSIILIVIVLMLVGAACIPLLNVQYRPVSNDRSLSVSFGYDASARVVESEVTSVVEGAMNTVSGVSDIRATSGQGWGYVTVTFKDGTDMNTARFEVATRLRQIRSKLPAGVTPTLGGSVGGRGGGSDMILSYTINADMPASEIVRYAEEHLVTPLSRIDGVYNVSTSGAMPFEWVLTFDPASLGAVGLSPSDLVSALGNYYRNSIAGTRIVENNMMLVRVRSKDLKGELERIPIRKVGDRLYYMGDFATVKYQEQTPYLYSRINGLNTIDLYVEAQNGINTLTVTDAVKQRMAELEESFPENFAIQLRYDASENLNNEIQKIFWRAVMALAILLLFVLAVSRNFRYMLVIGLTIAANLLIAFIFYVLFGIDIELYSMAGITVSLGIIIDTAIVIADHYSYYGNRKVMASIAGALLTTIAALLLIFFLPEQARANLTDFIWVIVINLTLSMIIAFLFVPALLEKVHLENKGVVKNSMKRMRRLVGTAGRYTRVTEWGRRHRWAYIVAIVLVFGIPLHLLPESVSHKNADKEEDRLKGGLAGLYNSTIGSKWYQKFRPFIEYPLGGVFHIYQKHSSGGFNMGHRDEEPREVVLNVYANMAEGMTVQQLNDVVVEMENWLQQFDEISMFRTSLGGTSGSIEIHFKDEFQHTRFPYELKQRLWAKAIRYGGATWGIPALDENDQYLSNSVYRTSWSNTIDLYGYSYDLLYRYAEDLIDSLKTNRRVPDAGFSAGYNSYVGNEFRLNFNREKIVRSGINVGRYYSYLGEQLYNGQIGQVFDGEKNVPVRLCSSQTDYYDLWHIRNDMVDIDGVQTRLSDVGSIEKRRTGMDIERQNQEYVISVGYDFIGSYDIQMKFIYDQIGRLEKVLPMGFRVDSNYYYYGWNEQKQKSVLIVVVILIIFMICATMFESLLQPLSIIVLIPVSFIGMFLAYTILKIPFGQGAFAAMIMLCGITVNAGIYLTAEYRTICAASGRSGLRQYVKAYNRKIVPTLLTILSTVLGLIPFLFDGRDDMFWFSFAVGVMSGMLFSVLAIVYVLPVFFPLKGNSRSGKCVER